MIELLAKVRAPRQLQSTTGEELRPLFGQMLRPQGRAFKGEP